MPTHRGSILTAGLGRFAATDANAQAHFGPGAGERARELLATSVEKAKNAGFDVVTIDINPNEPGESLDRFLSTLRSGDFVGVNIGYGVRGHKEHTELFEKLLNHAWACKPGIKIMFSNGPDEVITAIKRSFPEAFAESN
ncbi:hypothetical protein BDY17DRAFT_293984 [Neohortaea acidophila]|uniref:Uncharacterized protein n=1 Tax=Neohortaea acidophila TaxID=245834 RepID=A0A6A6Q2I3_9PEZI|nr:uncharacterized protein BDY17DRAFT_293984 [Neohortaea acidophila]KAF2485627.1 hypothetical protein BDY17DRAFT_293984 [Neohortaea acidophila]